MRVVFMGTPTFALPTLRALIASSHDVIAVYTAPPRPAHRGQKVTFSPVNQLAEVHNIPVYTPVSLKTGELQQAFVEHDADIAVVVAYGLLLPPAILSAYPHGCINIHPSSLPRWRGAAPIQRTIMAGDVTTSICIMQMDAGLDTGAVLMEDVHTITPHSTAYELEAILAEKAAPLLIQSLKGIEQHTLFPMPQLMDGVTYAAKITKHEYVIDFSLSSHEIINYIHGLGGSYMFYHGERIKWLRAEAVTTDNTQPAGTIRDALFTVQCGVHGIRPVTLQRAGKEAMPAEECLRGINVVVGTKIG